MQLIIELRGNGAESLYRSCRLEFKDQATIKQLQSELRETFFIEARFQEIFHKETRIDLLAGNSTLCSHVANNETLVLKHSKLKSWEQFEDCFTSIKKEKYDHKIGKLVKSAISSLKILEKCKFFDAYVADGKKVNEFNDKYAHYVDSDYEFIELAAKDYFLSLFENNPQDPDVVVNCSPKEKSGAQGGLICEVTKEGNTVAEYHIKTHLGISRSAKYHQNVDLREIFVYKLLELIKVGPKVHFLPVVQKSRFGLYIATEDVNGFHQKSEKPLNYEEHLKCALLRNILILTDLHSDNYGSDGEGKLSIVDFQVGRQGTKGMQIYWKDNKKNHSKIVECIKLWNLPKIFDSADDAITHQKNFLAKRNIARQLSDEYKTYLQEIKDNVSVVLASNDDEDNTEPSPNKIQKIQ